MFKCSGCPFMIYLSLCSGMLQTWQNSGITHTLSNGPIEVQVCWCTGEVSTQQRCQQQPKTSDTNSWWGPFQRCSSKLFWIQLPSLVKFSLKWWQLKQPVLSTKVWMEHVFIFFFFLFLSFPRLEDFWLMKMVWVPKKHFSCFLFVSTFFSAKKCEEQFEVWQSFWECDKFLRVPHSWIMHIKCAKYYQQQMDCHFTDSWPWPCWSLSLHWTLAAHMDFP